MKIKVSEGGDQFFIMNDYNKIIGVEYSMEAAELSLDYYTHISPKKSIKTTRLAPGASNE